MGELARKPGCPELPKSPIDLFTLRPGDNYSTAEKFFWPFLAAVRAAYGIKHDNKSAKRPNWAGIHRIFFAFVLTATAVTLIQNYKLASVTETAEVLKHYITLHPDDFPPYERKRWKDVYLPFNPIR